MYPIFGLFLSLSAPIGWLIYRVGWSHFKHPFEALDRVYEELVNNSAIFAFLSILAILVLAAFGYLLGRAEDSLYAHYRRSLSQRRLLGIKNRQLARLSITDRLTGLANRARLMEVLTLEYRRARRYSLDLCVLLIDIDHFKAINDASGHLFGDFILSELGQLFAGNLRDSDYVARTGGEEFGFVLTLTNIDDALRFAERLRDTVAHHRFEHDGARTEVTVSGGVASINDLVREEELTVDRGLQLLARADEALYEAKRLGRNRIVRWNPGTHD
ncbi:MAG: GGDEF domain-containing protein [Pseudomonadota bacterium]